MKCPFCGSHDVNTQQSIVEYHDGYEEVAGYHVYCQNCGAHSPICKTEEDAERKWKSVIPADIPNPGSDAARKLGCICAVMDNSHGRGYAFDKEHGYYVFSWREDCPLHGC